MTNRLYMLTMAALMILATSGARVLAAEIALPFADADEETPLPEPRRPVGLAPVVSPSLTQAPRPAPVTTATTTSIPKAFGAASDDDAGQKDPNADLGGINMSSEEIAFRGIEQRFDVVAVVNKAADVQTMTVYRFKLINGVRQQDGKPKVFKVSTGKERWSCEAKRDANGNTLAYEARWTGTPTGYFTPEELDPDHHSSLYDQANMFKFIRLKGAVGVHETPDVKRHTPLLGTQDSHGCIRLGVADSETLFKYVLQSGGPISPTSAMFNGRCDVKGAAATGYAHSEKTCAASINDPLAFESCRLEVRDQFVKECQQSAPSRTPRWQKMAAAAVTEGPAAGYGPYPQTPLVTNLDQSGHVKPNQPTKNGPAALFVVQCVNLKGVDCSNTKLPAKRDCGAPSAPVAAPALAQASPQPPVSGPAKASTSGSWARFLISGGARN